MYIIIPVRPEATYHAYLQLYARTRLSYIPMCYTCMGQVTYTFPCVTRGTGNLNVPHVLHVGNLAIISQNM